MNMAPWIINLVAGLVQLSSDEDYMSSIKSHPDRFRAMVARLKERGVLQNDDGSDVSDAELESLNVRLHEVNADIRRIVGL